MTSQAFAKRLKGLGNQVRLEVFNDLCHGFLMFSAIHEPSSKASKICSGWIRDVIDGDDFSMC
jgi:hypothetical protein